MQPDSVAKIRDVAGPSEAGVIYEPPKFSNYRFSYPVGELHADSPRAYLADEHRGGVAAGSAARASTDPLLPSPSAASAAPAASAAAAAAGPSAAGGHSSGQFQIQQTSLQPGLNETEQDAFLSDLDCAELVVANAKTDAEQERVVQAMALDISSSTPQGLLETMVGLGAFGGEGGERVIHARRRRH